jgi:uncharacterized repeat protein (TIGR01451 family)
MRLVRVAAIAGMLTLLLAAPVSAGIVVDLSVVKVDTPDPVTAGANLTYTITLQNSDNSTADNVSLSDTLPAGTTFVSFSGPAGWTLTTPPVGGTGLLTATLAAFPANATAVFTLVVAVDAGIKPGIITNTATATTTTSELNTSNNTNTATTTVTAATPAASLQDAAMSAPNTGSPVAILGFAALLVGLLMGTAVLAVRRSRI